VAELKKKTLDGVYKKITLRMIPFLFICYLFNYLDRVNVGFAKLQMLGDLHMSETAYGLGAGIFFIGYVLCGVPSNLMLYKVGARRWLALMMVLWGMLSTSLMFIHNANEFYLVRLLTGASEAGFFPGLVRRVGRPILRLDPEPFRGHSRLNRPMAVALPASGPAHGGAGHLHAVPADR